MRTIEEIAAYWELLERANDTLMRSPDLRTGSAGRYELVEIAEQTYTPELLARANRLLQQAADEVADQPPRYRQRVAFARDGFEFFRLMIECIPLMERVRESDGRDAEAVRQAADNWDRIEQIVEKTSPHGFRFSTIASRMQGGYMGSMADHLGPPSQAAGLE